MQITTIATLEYRDSVPDGVNLNNKFNLQFLGIDDSLVSCFEKEWHDISNDRLKSANENIIKLEEGKKLIQDELCTLENQYKTSKKWFRRDNEETKNLSAKIEKHKDEIHVINLAIEKINAAKYYTPAELKAKASQFLIKNGFVIISKSSAGGEYPIHTEIWHRGSEL
jgi:hypothetical protein